MTNLKFIFMVTIGFILSGDCSSGSVKDTNSNETVKMHEFKNYVVFEKSYANKNTEDIVVMKRSHPNQLCKLELKNAFFVLKNQENGFFVNLIQKYLFMDYGTGPDARTLSVYDISNEKRVFETPYSDTISRIGNDTVSIWIESNDTNFSKCAVYLKWKENGLGAAIIVEHYFDLRTLKLYKTSHWKCEPRQ